MRLHSPSPISSTSANKGFKDVFISYGRADSKLFAAYLNDRLIAEGLEVWFDFEDIPLGVDFQTQIEDGIEKAHSFLFIISPHSVNSPYCAKEIELAVQYNKRIIPIMHVETIHYRTWKARYPGAHPDDWALYKAQGKHSSFANMHPVICKINWAYFREGLDDFETSFAGLLEIFNRQKDYVHQHTDLLARALDWQRNQKQSRYLLTGQMRIKAEQWLTIFFQDEQPPCVPTDLHCEFICESAKNANNLMTQVFLAYGEDDSELADKIRKVLMRHSLTVWTGKTAGQTADVAQAEVKKGIEGADTLVYLLTQQSLKSKSCQQALEHAFAHNKRVIPLQVEAVDMRATLSKRSRRGLDQIFSKLEGAEANPVMSKLQAIPIIEFSRVEEDAAYLVGIDELLQRLKQDTHYYEQHKDLLVKSLKWRDQGHNPSILLRGYRLEQSQAWLQVAQQRVDYPPIGVQEEFIAASLKQPPESSIDVFLCYSSVDADFVRQLNEALQLQGKTTWFDQENIAAGTDFLQETHRGIGVADNILFILSPDALTSTYCTDEYIYAQMLNKRLVTVLHRPVDLAQMPSELAKVQWIDFRRHQGDFYANFSELVRTLDVDREYVRSHNKWMQRALDWRRHDQSEDGLLRGAELTLAESWLQESEQQSKHPLATTLQRDFIKASGGLRDRIQRNQEEQRCRELRRVQRIAIAAIVTGITMAGLTLVAGIHLRAAEIEKIRALRASAEANFASGQELDALMASMRAGRTLQTSLLQAVWPQPELHNQVIGSLQKIFYAARERDRFLVQADSLMSSMVDQSVNLVSPNGRYLAASDPDGGVRLWDIQQQRQITWAGHPGPIDTILFSPDNQRLVTRGEEGAIRLWDLQGRLLSEIIGATDQRHLVRFNPDGARLATVGEDGGTMRLWDLQGRLAAMFPIHQGTIKDIEFSPDGLQVAAIGWDRVHLWTLQGHQKAVLQIDADTIMSLDFSPDAERLATGDNEGQVVVWNVEGGRLSAWKGHQGSISQVQFSPDGRHLATASWDGVAYLWDLQGQELARFQDHREPIHSIRFSPDGKRLVIGEETGSVRVWNLMGEEIAVLRGHQRAVPSMSFMPDGQQLMTASLDGTLRLWDLQEKHWVAFPSHQGEVNSVRFSLDNQQLITLSEMGSARLWTRQGRLIAELQEQQEKIQEAGFSPDGHMLFARSENNVSLWDTQGHPIARLPHADSISGIWLSPDSQYVATAEAGGAVRLWDRKGRLISVLPGRQGLLVFWVSFSPTGDVVATADEAGWLRIWTFQSGEPELLAEWRGHQAGVNHVQFSPNGQQLLTTAWDGAVRLWNRQGERVSQLENLAGEVLSVRYTRGGPILALSQMDGSLHLHNLQGRHLAEFLGHQWELKKVNFSQDNQRLLTVDGDGSARVWTLGGSQLAEFGDYDPELSPIGKVLDISLSPDGELVATAGKDGLVRLWRIETLDALMVRGCAWLQGYLSGIDNAISQSDHRQHSGDSNLCPDA